jgi:HptB-dependent secretion and biofilm anti anti-sigma factor
MRIETYSRGDRLEVGLWDSLTSADLASFRGFLSEMKQTKCKTAVLDLSQLNWIDSAGLGMLILAKETAQKADLELVLASPKGHVKSLLELGRFDKIFTIQG